MRISHRYRFVFFASPKTGSSTVRQLLDPYSDVNPVKNYLHRNNDNPFYPHMLPREARPLFLSFGWDYDGYRKFIFVRNPWARLVSLYEHISAEENCGTFADWLPTVKPDGLGGGGAEHQRWRRHGSYSIREALLDDQERPLVDKVIRLEDIECELPTYLRGLGLPLPDNVPLAHKNRRGHATRYREYYTPELQNLVAENYRYDIERFGYSFEAGS